MTTPKYTGSGRYIELDGKAFIYLAYFQDKRTGARTCDPVDIDILGNKIRALLNAADLPSTYDERKK